MTSRTHDNFRHNFWTWVDPPPVWTMFKKTALFWNEGIPYLSNMSQKYVGKQLLWLSSLHGLHPENSPLCPISWIYTMSPLTHSHQHKAHSFWWSQIYFAVFYEPGEGAWNQNHLSWTGLCFANFKDLDLKSAGPNGPGLSESESRNLFFQGQPVLMYIMALPWPASLAPSSVGKETISCAPRKQKLYIVHDHSFNWNEPLLAIPFQCCSRCWYLICLCLFWEDEKWIIDKI